LPATQHRFGVAFTDNLSEQIERQFFSPELSMGWVNPWLGLGRDFSDYSELGWVGSTLAKF